MNTNDANNRYNILFTTEEKARAFDKIAEKYYFTNFGSISKTDFDVLMFSIYIEQIMDKNPNDFSAYSDYTLSKQLGITQTKISNLKVKKQLQYPYDKFNWRQSLLRISDNAIFEDNKIKLLIPDKNIYIEVKNAIESMGGFVEIQLTPNLLQVSLVYFLDLLIELSDENSVSREDLRKNIKEKIESFSADIKIMDKQPFGKALKEKTPDMLIDIISECIPVFGGAAKVIGKNIYHAIRQEKG